MPSAREWLGQALRSGREATEAAEQYRAALAIRSQEEGSARRGSTSWQEPRSRDISTTVPALPAAASHPSKANGICMAMRENTTAFWGEIFQLAMQALRANKMRALLTMLGVVIGSASIVLVVTVALDRQALHPRADRRRGRESGVCKRGRSGDGRAHGLADQITPADLAAVKQGLPESGDRSSRHEYASP